VKINTIKRLGVPSSLIAAILALSSCAEIAMVPVAAVGIPLAALFMVGFAGVATISQALDGFDSEQRKREENARKDGPFTEHWPNGKKSAVGSYKNKKLNGLYTTYYKNGRKKSEVIYEGGKRSGPHTSWHENGQKSVEGVFKKGEQSGYIKAYHENGQMSYLKGDGPNRTNTTWHQNGQKESVTKFKNGELIFRQKWNDKGNELELLQRTPD